MMPQFKLIGEAVASNTYLHAYFLEPSKRTDMMAKAKDFVATDQHRIGCGPYELPPALLTLYSMEPTGIGAMSPAKASKPIKARGGKKQGGAAIVTQSF